MRKRGENKNCDDTKRVMSGETNNIKNIYGGGDNEDLKMHVGRKEETSKL